MKRMNRQGPIKGSKRRGRAVGLRRSGSKMVRAAVLGAPALVWLCAALGARGEGEGSVGALRDAVAAQLATAQGSEEPQASGGAARATADDQLIVQAVGAGQAAGFTLLPQFRTPSRACGRCRDVAHDQRGGIRIRSLVDPVAL